MTDLLTPRDPRGRRGRLRYNEQRVAREQAETARTGLDLTPKPALHPFSIHPKCLHAARAGHACCSRCAWLLELDTEDARWFGSKFDDPEVP